MPVVSDPIKKNKKLPRYKLIANDLRKAVRGVEPGQMLSPERDLADHYSVSYMTIRKAVGILVREGVVKRYPGRGTVISNRQGAGEIAIIVRPELLDANRSPYYNLASNLLVDKIHSENEKWQVRLHVGKATPRGEDFPATLDLLNERFVANLRGVFTFHPLYEVGKKLEELNVPVVNLAMGKKFGGYQVGFDQSDVFNEGLSHLAERGCRSVGLITRSWFSGENGLRSATQPYFTELARKYGLAHSPEWSVYNSGDTYECHGYEAFTRLWDNSERPEGLLVTDDVLCQGVLRASLHLGVTLPEDLSLVSYASEGIDISYHRSLTRIAYDVREQIVIAADMMSNLFKGRDVAGLENIKVLSGKLIVGETT